MRTVTAIVAIVIGFGPVNALGSTRFQSSGAQQKPVEQVVVLTVRGNDVNGLRGCRVAGRNER